MAHTLLATEQMHTVTACPTGNGFVPGTGNKAASKQVHGLCAVLHVKISMKIHIFVGCDSLCLSSVITGEAIDNRSTDERLHTHASLEKDLTAKAVP